MIWVDWAIIGILLLSAIFGFLRGMLRELISLGMWVAAILIARTFGPQVSEMLAPYVDSEPARTGLGFALTVAVVVLLGSIAAKVAKTLVTVTGLGGVDRVFGFLFGAVRGLAILIVLTAVVSLTPLKDNSWWSQSQFIPMLEELRDQAAGLVDRQIS